MHDDINTKRTELANQMAAAGAANLDFTGTAAVLAAIPDTDPQQYVAAGAPENIASILPATICPQRRQKHGERPNTPLAFGEPAATSGDAPADAQVAAARAVLEQKWDAEGACASCGWHAALGEYHVDADDIRDALQHGGKLILQCISKDDETRDSHRGVSIDLIARIERLTAVPEQAPSAEQEWAKVDPAVAFHLIERHAENWADAGRMMLAWRDANPAPATASGDERADFEAWIKSRVGYPFAGTFTNLMWDAWQARAAVSAATKPTALNANELLRYDSFETDEGDELRVDPDGRWVRFDDVQSLLTATSAASTTGAARTAEQVRDAERYRWLRNPDTDVALVLDKRTGFVPPDESVPGAGGFYTYEYRAGEELDAAIDAAMARPTPTNSSEAGDALSRKSPPSSVTHHQPQDWTDPMTTTTPTTALADQLKTHVQRLYGPEPTNEQFRDALHIMALTVAASETDDAVAANLGALWLETEAHIERQVDAALARRAAQPVAPVQEDERFLRAGRNLHDLAKRLGWPDDGEGAYEYVQRLTYELGREDATPSPQIAEVAELPQDFRERFKDAYQSLSVAVVGSPFWNQSMEELLSAVDAELNKRADAIAASRRAAGGEVLGSPDEWAALCRFRECCDDFDSGGHDVDKAMMRRLEQIGVVRSIGFGRHEMTDFGNWLHDYKGTATPAPASAGQAAPPDVGDILARLSKNGYACYLIGANAEEVARLASQPAEGAGQAGQVANTPPFNVNLVRSMARKFAIVTTGPAGETFRFADEALMRYVEDIAAFMQAQRDHDSDMAAAERAAAPAELTSAQVKP